MLLCVLKTNLVLIMIFVLLIFINICLTIATFTGIKSFEVAAGVLGGKINYLNCVQIIMISSNYKLIYLLFLFKKKIYSYRFFLWLVSCISNNIGKYTFLFYFRNLAKRTFANFIFHKSLKDRV